MKTSRFFATFLAIIICAFAADTGYAKGMRGSKPKATPTPEKSSAHSTIVSVSNTEISVKAGHDKKQFRIDAHTNVTINGNRAPVSALKIGMYADITPDGFNPTTAMAIAATTATGN
jgi:hypothetical protein